MHQQIPSRYPTKQTTIPLSSRQLTMTVINAPDELLEELSHEDSDGTLHLPYWTYLWPSAVGLAHHLDSAENLSGARILEIGCGFGLAGIVACQMGASVLFTDYEIDPLMFARYNAIQNGCIDRATFVQMDWNAPCLQGQFSHILASDVIFEDTNWQPILALIQRHLTEDGEVLFSEPNRVNAPGFFELIQTHGFGYHRYSHTVTLEGETSAITVYSVKSNPPNEEDSNNG